MKRRVILATACFVALTAAQGCTGNQASNTRTAACVMLAIGFQSCPDGPVLYDRTAMSEIHSIALLTPSVPQNVSVRSYDPSLVPSTGGSGGGEIVLLPLIAGELLVRNSLQSNREAQLNSAVASHPFSPGSSLVETIANELESAGYQVEIAPVSREDAEFLGEYPMIADADAVLDLVIEEIGYARDRGCWYNCFSLPFTDLEYAYRPRVTARARLVQANDSSLLMMQTVRYNPDANRARAISERPIEIMPNPIYEFVEFAEIEEGLLADETRPIDGLEDAVFHVAEAIANLLERPSS